jgi:putative transposase
VNRGNDRRRIFFEGTDYERFLRLMLAAKRRYPVKLFGLCLMPNHFHALIQPERDGALSAYVQWVLARYSCYLRSQTGTLGYGHVFQRRFWNAGIEDTLHFLTVLRYIEANPVRAGLVTDATLWPWSSAALRSTGRGQLLDALPVVLPASWSAIVNSAEPRDDLDRICPLEPHRRALDTTRPLLGPKAH